MGISTLRIPSMYADHHVKMVRDALGALSGVQEVQASAAFKEVTVKHSKELTEEVLTQALEKAGYAVGKPEEPPEQEPSHLGDPGWYACAPRSIKTQRVDLEMSGDFRMY
jgi:copper chaperone CopZ